MKLHHVQLSEGLIKVPEKLEQSAMKGLTNVILSQMASDIEAQYGPGSELNQFRLWARKAYPGSRITHTDVSEGPVEVRLPPVKKEDFDPRYQRAIPAGTIPTPRLVMTGENIGGAGEYDAENDLISIAMNRVANWDWDLYGRAVQYGGEKGQKAASEILGRAGDLINSMRGALKHELMHYVQFNALAHAHGDQVDASKGDPMDNDAYYQSQTEFDPQIESAVADTMSLISKLQRNVSNPDFRAVASFVTGATPRARLVQILGNDKLVPAEPSKFFTTLQRTDPEQWKKAVRKFYQTLADRLP